MKTFYDVADKCGFFSVFLTEDGTLDSKLMGIITHRDIRYRTDMEIKLKEVKISWEHTGYKWLPYEQARGWLAFKNTKEIFKKANYFFMEHKT